MIKRVLANKNGAIMVFILFLFASIMIIIASLISLTRQTYNGVMTQQLNTKSYYLTMGAADTVIAALVKDEPRQGRLIDDFINMPEEEKEAFGGSEADNNYAELNYGDGLGESRIKLDLDRDDDGRWWITAYITTRIPDYRLNVGYKNETNPHYELYYEYRILLSDPNIQGFDLLTEDKAVAG